MILDMSLTRNDLTAISHLINLSADGLEKRLTESIVERIDKLDDTLAIQTENGLQEIRDQVSKVSANTNRQELSIKKIRQTLHAA